MAIDSHTNVQVTFCDENVEIIEQAIAKELDALAADGLIDLHPLALGIRTLDRGKVDRDNRTVSFEVEIHDPSTPPYRAIGDQDEIDARLRAAIEKALLHGSACTSSSAPNAQ